MSGLLNVGVNLVYLRPGNVGGSETYTRELIRHMQELPGVSLTLFCNKESFDTFEPADRTRVVLVSERKFSGVNRVVDENVVLLKHLRKAQIDVLFSPANIGAPALPNRIPQVVTVHDLQHVALKEHFSWSKRMARSLMFRVSCWRCRRIVAVSEHTRRDVVKEFKLPPAKVVTIYEGVDPNLRAPDDRVDATLERFDLGRRSYLYFPAMLTPHKNHAVLLEALATAFPAGGGPQLIFSGKPTEYLAELERLIEERGLGGRVRYLGYVTRAEVLDLMTGCLAVTYPSSFEGFGLPILEAMSCGAPVIASSASSIPEVAGDAAVLVPPDDPAGWAEAVTRLTGDSGFAGELAARGAAQVARFSWSACASATVEVLEAAAGR